MYSYFIFMGTSRAPQQFTETKHNSGPKSEPCETSTKVHLAKATVVNKVGSRQQVLAKSRTCLS